MVANGKVDGRRDEGTARRVAGFLAMTRTLLLAFAAPLALAACTATEATPETAESATPAREDPPMTTPAPVPESTRTPAGETTQPPPVEPEDSSDRCGADKVRARWTGALPTEEVKADIAAKVGDRPIRYYGMGDPITMDFSEDRLNVVLGKDGRIARFRCG